MRSLWCISVVVVVVVAGLAMLTVRSSAADNPRPGKVYELRTYKANPGKLEALHTRFRDHTCRLFKKHGMEMIGF
jgi:hypothetical protein